MVKTRSNPKPPIKRTGTSSGGRVGKPGTSMVTKPRFHGAVSDPKKC